MAEQIINVKEDIVKLLEILEIADHPPLISKSLVQFAEENGLSSDDVIMLSHINYRGRVPENISQWGMLYAVIKNVLGSQNNHV